MAVVPRARRRALHRLWPLTSTPETALRRVLLADIDDRTDRLAVDRAEHRVWLQAVDDLNLSGVSRIHEGLEHRALDGQVGQAQGKQPTGLDRRDEFGSWILLGIFRVEPVFVLHED